MHGDNRQGTQNQDGSIGCHQPSTDNCDLRARPPDLLCRRAIALRSRRAEGNVQRSRGPPVGLGPERITRDSEKDLLPQSFLASLSGMGTRSYAVPPELPFRGRSPGVSRVQSGPEMLVDVPTRGHDAKCSATCHAPAASKDSIFTAYAKRRSPIRRSPSAVPGSLAKALPTFVRSRRRPRVRWEKRERKG